MHFFSIFGADIFLVFFCHDILDTVSAYYNTAVLSDRICFFLMAKAGLSVVAAMNTFTTI